MSGESTLRETPETPWQLRMYQKSLKKRQKVELLMRLMGPVQRERCLLISGHDNNGAMNWHFRAAGGTWSWGQVYAEGIPEMAEFTPSPRSPRGQQPSPAALRRSCRAHDRRLGFCPRWMESP